MIEEFISTKHQWTSEQCTWRSMPCERGDITVRTDTNADCRAEDVGGGGGDHQVAPFLTSPRVSWHICDDAEGRTPVARVKGRYVWIWGGLWWQHAIICVRYRAEVSKHVQNKIRRVCRVACRKI
jgi:hypothetical protein